jgi:Tfp pilus assembly protein PilP
MWTGDEAAADPVVETPKGQESHPIERQYTYDPDGRRDPFVSPAEALAEKLGPRPEGIAGMSVDDLDLTGFVSSPTGAVAVVTGADGESYFLRVGDQTYRATVLAIDPEAETMTIREQIDDPNSIKPYRDRVLRLESSGMSP